VESDCSLALFVVNGIRVGTSGLWDAEESDDSTQKLKGKEDPENTTEANGALVHGVVALRPPIETNTRENGTELANGSAESVGKTTDTGWEDFTRYDKGGGIWSKVEEELSNDDEGKATTGSNLVAGTSENAKHEGGDEETLDLDPLAAEEFDKGNCEEVSGNVTGDGNDQVAFGILQEVVIWVFASGIANVGQDDRLIQVDTVKCNINQEPGKGAAKEGEGVSGFAKVLEESLELDILWCVGAGSNGFNDGSAAVSLVAAVSAENLFAGNVDERLVEVSLGGDIGKLNRLGKLARFWHGQTEIEKGKAWNEGQSNLNAPDAINFAKVAVSQGFLENSE